MPNPNPRQAEQAQHPSCSNSQGCCKELCLKGVPLWKCFLGEKPLKSIPGMVESGAQGEDWLLGAYSVILNPCMVPSGQRLLAWLCLMLGH